MGLFEIHCHTLESSICGKVPARELVKMHKEAGFEGICLTDHYNDYHFADRFNDDVMNFLKGYRLAKEYGDEIGLKVLFGVEYRFCDTNNDYLVFGITEDFVIRNPDVYKLTLKEFRNRFQGEDLIIIQAHPGRDGQKRIDVNLLDGMEVVNGNPRHEARNEQVFKYAKENNLLMTGASDYHRDTDLFLACMEFENEINDEKELVREIKAGRYQIIDNTRFA
ncbi:MAG TPA: PHP domain-containing protein [Clostridia bacterium]|nr:PHP domain-containing protein [Clostridia bacterium]HPQ47756.1 PHP domain-containing protein [Clostridia bacterium]HRX41511.1 PHP domain-containing protein [Clostridia bacterium]